MIRYTARLNIRVTPELAATLTALATRDRLSLGVYIRQVLERSTAARTSRSSRRLGETQR